MSTWESVKARRRLYVRSREQEHGRTAQSGSVWGTACEPFTKITFATTSLFDLQKLQSRNMHVSRWHIGMVIVWSVLVECSPVFITAEMGTR